jgi:hypothetical protein
VVDTAPLALVVTSAENDGAVQLTEIELLIGEPRVTVGWPGSVLHSRMLPIELAVNPLPVSFTAWPLVKPVEGTAVRVPTAAKAEIVVTRRTEPATTRSEAATMRTFAQASRAPKSTPANLDRRDDRFTTHSP